MTAAIVARSDLCTVHEGTDEISGPRRRSSMSADDRVEVGRVIRAAHKRPGGDVGKTFFARYLAVKIELLRRDVLDDRQMFRSRTQILAHGQNLTPCFAQIVHRLKQFRFGFTKTEHDATLGHDFW